MRAPARPPALQPRRGSPGRGVSAAAPGQAALGVSERRTVAGAAGSQGGRRRVVSVGGRSCNEPLGGTEGSTAHPGAAPQGTLAPATRVHGLGRDVGVRVHGLGHECVQAGPRVRTGWATTRQSSLGAGPATAEACRSSWERPAGLRTTAHRQPERPAAWRLRRYSGHTHMKCDARVRPPTGSPVLAPPRAATPRHATPRASASHAEGPGLMPRGATVHSHAALSKPTSDLGS